MKNMSLVTILNEVENAITDENNGILKKINDLMDAGEDATKKKPAIVGLIGSIILLVIKCIKAAVAED